eukprot:119159-Lingulodinium_polyedra.AAC.1
MRFELRPGALGLAAPHERPPAYWRWPCGPALVVPTTAERRAKASGFFAEPRSTRPHVWARGAKQAH